MSERLSFVIAAAKEPTDVANLGFVEHHFVGLEPSQIHEQRFTLKAPLSIVGNAVVALPIKAPKLSVPDYLAASWRNQDLL
jgi:hypothetical protein